MKEREIDDKLRSIHRIAFMTKSIGQITVAIETKIAFQKG